LLAGSPALAQKEFGFDNRKPSGQPYLTPEESLRRLRVAPEFEVKLFAAEPLVVNPIAFTIDEKGRVWVVECFEYPKRAGKNAPRDRIVILEDTDGDGVCDKRTVFAEGKDFPVTPERKAAGLGAFDMASGIEVGHGGVFVGAPPYLWFIENKNDKPGKFEVLLKGFGSQDTHETLNTFQWGPDGWLYGLHGVFTNSEVKPGQLDGPATRMNAAVWRYHPTRKTFEIFAEGTSNPWGMDWRNTDGQFILCCCVIPHLFHIVPGGIYKRQAGASFNPHAYGYLNEICDHTFHRESGWAHAGLISLDAPHIPEKYRDSVIFGSIHGCSVKRNVLKPNGSTFTASRADDFLVSGDKNFRPINMKWGPLGDIYLIDWHDQNPCHQAAPDSWDYERGRVYRIQLKGTRPKKAEDLGKKTNAELAGMVIEDDNPYRARQAQRLVRERTGPVNGQQPPFPQDEFDIVQRVLKDGPADRQVRAMWLMNSIPVSVPDLKHAHPLVRAWGVRKIEATSIKGVTERELKEATEKAAVETDPVVRRELASAGIRLADKHDVTPLVRALMAHKEDAKDPVIPQLVWLAYEKVISKKDGASTPVEKELMWLAEQAPGNEFVREQIVPKVMRRLVATGHPDDLKHCVKFVASVKDAATREKALDGLAVALRDQTVNAPEGWAELRDAIAKENDPRLVALANKLAVSFRDPEAIRRAVAVAANTGLPAAPRVEAVRQIGTLKVKEAVPLLLNVLRKDAEVSVRCEAARSLAAFDAPTLAADILSTWKDYPRPVRADVVNTLSVRKEWAKALLTAMADKKIDRAEVTDNVILRIQAFKDKELNALIERAWGRTRPTPAELNALIDKTRESLYAAAGSFARGKVVFENNCAKCHKFDGKGADVGPALDGAARDVEYILVNVLDPNRVIGAPYFVRVARLADGTVQQGVLAEEDEKSITLKVENGVLKKIAKADLESPVQVVEKSLMPEGLGYNMTPQDFRDLVRYLMANPFLTEVTVNGERKPVGVPGRIALPDTKGGPAVVEADVTVPDDMKTQLLVGSSADFEVRLDGQAVGTGKGTGKQVQPDQVGFEVVLPKGAHKLTVVVKGGAGQAVYARFLDPDRKLRYPDSGEKR
jgi:putative membrane-bound dehydrogenase-like protein